MRSSIGSSTSGAGSSTRPAIADEKALSYALAVFLALRDLDAGEARRHLKDNPRSYLKHARRHLEKQRSADVARLRGAN